MNINKKLLKQIIVIVSIIVLLLLITGLIYNKLTIIDDTVYKFIIQFKSAFLTKVFKGITFFASITWFIILTIILFFIIKDKRINMYLIINLLVIALITLGLKSIFTRERPYELMIIKEFGYSFPSGHSSISMAFYGFIGYLVYKSSLKRYKKIILITLLLGLSVLIGVSRIYLGVHYPSDVLAGFTVGIIYLMIYTVFWKYIENRRTK